MIDIPVTIDGIYTSNNRWYIYITVTIDEIYTSYNRW